MPTKPVQLEFGGDSVRTTISLGDLATDDHFVEAGRARVAADRDVGRFRRGCVIDE